MHAVDKGCFTSTLQAKELACKPRAYSLRTFCAQNKRVAVRKEFAQQIIYAKRHAVTLTFERSDYEFFIHNP